MVIATVSTSWRPFAEPGADAVLTQVLAAKSFSASSFWKFLEVFEHHEIILASIETVRPGF